MGPNLNPKERTMSAQKITRIVAIAVVASFAALTPAPRIGVASVSAAAERKGDLHVTKECSEYFGAAGDWCTVTVSNLRRLPVGSRFSIARRWGFRRACWTATSSSTRGTEAERSADARSTWPRVLGCARSLTGPGNSPGSRPASMSRARGTESSATWMARTASLHRLIDRQQRGIETQRGWLNLVPPSGPRVADEKSGLPAVARCGR